MEGTSRIAHALVPIDGSSLAEQAIPYAQSLVGSNGHITLLRVLGQPESVYDPLGATLLTGAELLVQAREQAERELLAAQARWGTEGYAPITMVTLVGDPVEEILNAARDRSADVIVMASKGRGAFGRLTLGSVTDRVTRTSTLPVLVIRSNDALVDLSRPLLRRMVVPLDGSDRAMAALPVAATLAKQLHASVHLVTVADFVTNAPPAVAYGAAYSQNVYDDYMAGVVKDATTSLESMANPVTELGVDTTVEVVDGTAAEALIDLARHGDIIVMTSHGRGGFRRWLLGSVAEKLIRYSPAPVMLVPARHAVHAEAPAAE
ncbi:MAG: universal stress protein [Thermomicrobiales bacterium]|nr:universal stress protein [Thermomicrobiales bacterium]